MPRGVLINLLVDLSPLLLGFDILGIISRNPAGSRELPSTHINEPLRFTKSFLDSNVAFLFFSSRISDRRYGYRQHPAGRRHRAQRNPFNIDEETINSHLEVARISIGSVSLKEPSTFCPLNA
jgi:hypothetical protein